MVVLGIKRHRTSGHNLHNPQGKNQSTKLPSHLPSFINVRSMVGGRKIRSRWLRPLRLKCKLYSSRSNVRLLRPLILIILQTGVNSMEKTFNNHPNVTIYNRHNIGLKFNHNWLCIYTLDAICFCCLCRIVPSIICEVLYSNIQET